MHTTFASSLRFCVTYKSPMSSHAHIFKISMLVNTLASAGVPQEKLVSRYHMGIYPKIWLTKKDELHAVSYNAWECVY